MDEGKVSSRRYSDLTLYKRLLAQCRSCWLYIGSIFALQVLATPVALLTPVPLKLVVDNVLGNQPLPPYLANWLPEIVSSGSGLLVLSVSLLVVFAAVSEVLGNGVLLLSTYTSQKLALGFRTVLFQHVQRLSLIYHDSKGSHDSTYRIQYDAPAVTGVALNGLLPFGTAIVKVAAMIYVTVRIDWQLALVALTISPFLSLLAQAYRGRMRAQWREVRQSESSAMSAVQEALTAVRVVKAFGQEEQEKERFVRRCSSSVGAYLKAAFSEAGYSMLVSMITAFGSAAVLYIGARHVQSGALSLGALLLVTAYLTQLYEPLRSIGSKAAMMQAQLASAERVFSVLDEAPEVVENLDARSLVRASGAIAFHNVSFGYQPDRMILRNISFEVAPRTRVGIVGRTGAGKTTLVNLISRFYDPNSGQILLDGADLREYRLADLRNQLAIVIQEPLLFSTSIGENIAYARRDARMEDIIAAAKLAGADDFIAALPEGYDTLVGERGMKLSGGERQRVALARAFLKDAPILILDEPTSSVDVKTEAQILEAMQRLMRDRTTFVVAHRPSTIVNCELLLVLRNGQLTLKEPRGLDQSLLEELVSGGDSRTPIGTATIWRGGGA